MCKREILNPTRNRWGSIFPDADFEQVDFLETKLLKNRMICGAIMMFALPKGAFIAAVLVKKLSEDVVAACCTAIIGRLGMYDMALTKVAQEKKTNDCHTVNV